MRDDVARVLNAWYRMRHWGELLAERVGLPHLPFMILMMAADGACKAKQSAGALCASDLAKRSGLSRAAVSQGLRALEDRGLVQRTPNPRDRRIAHVVLTGEGIGAVARVGEYLAGFVGRLLEGMTKEETELVVRTLERAAAMIGSEAAARRAKESRKESTCENTCVT